MKKRWIIPIVSLSLLVGCSEVSHVDAKSTNPNVSVASVKLTDIKGHWAEKTINEMVNKGIVEGYPNKSFKPENKVTRAEFATFLARAIPAETPNATEPFSDVSDSYWAKDSIAKGIELGFIKSSDYANSKFNPEQTMTRTEIAKWMVNGLVSINEEYKQAIVETKNTLLPVPEFYKGGINQQDIPYIAVAMGTGLLTGYEDYTFRPSGKTTRAEVSTIISRYLKVMNKAPHEFLHLNELREVGVTGTNLTSLTDYEYGKSTEFNKVVNKPITFKNNVGVAKVHRLIFIDATASGESVYHNMFSDKTTRWGADKYNAYTEMSFTANKDTNMDGLYTGTSNIFLNGSNLYGENAQKKFGISTISPYDTKFKKGTTKRFWLQSSIAKTLREGEPFKNYAIEADDGSYTAFGIKK